MCIEKTVLKAPNPLLPLKSSLGLKNRMSVNFLFMLYTSVLMKHLTRMCMFIARMIFLYEKIMSCITFGGEIDLLFTIF